MILASAQIKKYGGKVLVVTNGRQKGLTLSAFEWEKDRKTLIYGQVDYMYGEALYKPEMKEGNPSSDNDIQLMVYSIRE